MQLGGKELRVAGGLVRTASVAEGYEFVEDPAAFVELLRESGTGADLFTFIQRLSDTSSRFNYPMESDNLAVIQVSTFDHWFKRQVDSKTRNMIRKAEKSGVEVREVPFDDDLLAGISRLNNETPIRQNRPYWHYGDDLDTVRRKNGSFAERSVFLGAFLEGALIGYVKMTSDERHEQAGLMQIMSMIRHRDKAPTNALVAHAVRSCADRGIRYLWYARLSYRHKQPDRLAEFKRNNGFQQVDVPRYFVPLTIRGRLALRLGMQHGLAERLPDPLLSGVRQLRDRWYGVGGQRAKKSLP